MAIAASMSQQDQAESGPTGVERPRLAQDALTGGFSESRGVLALQRTAGNAAVTSLLRPVPRAVARARCESAEPEDDVLARGRRALSESVVARRATNQRVLARYAHQDCSDPDLKDHVWPADYFARQMVKKGIKALSATPMEPAVAAVLAKYFMAAPPKVAKVLSVLDKVDAAFRANDYTYECETECDPNEVAYTWSGVTGSILSAHIHICMGKLDATVTNECLARSIIHEFTHRYGNVDDTKPNNNCKNPSNRCDFTSQCPPGLTPDGALDNADSYAGLVYELWPMSLLTASAEPAGDDAEPATATA